MYFHAVYLPKYIFANVLIRAFTVFGIHAHVLVQLVWAFLMVTILYSCELETVSVHTNEIL